MSDEQTLSRRRFLQGVGLGVTTLCLGACALRKTAPGPADYYAANKATILKDADEQLRFIQRFVAEAYGSDEARELLAESRKGFEDRLPGLPYIGGARNSLTAVMYQAAISLSFYIAMKARAHTLEDTGRILYLATESFVSQPDALGGADVRTANSKSAQDATRREAEESQKRTYAGDWVFTFVPGDGTSFDWGIDYSECGLCKYYAQQGAMELAPYICLGDVPMSRLYETGLVRTTTLAHGGPRCDFRFKHGRPVQIEWTPDFLKES